MEVDILEMRVGVRVDRLLIESAEGLPSRGFLENNGAEENLGSNLQVIVNIRLFI